MSVDIYSRINIKSQPLAALREKFVRLSTAKDFSAKTRDQLIAELDSVTPKTNYLYWNERNRPTTDGKELEFSPNIKDPESSFLWAIRLAHIAKRDGNKFYTGKLWEQFASSKGVAQENKEYIAYIIASIGVNQKTLVKWEKVGDGRFFFSPESNFIGLDLITFMAIGFDAALAIALHEIAHSKITTKFTPRMRELREEIDALVKKRKSTGLTDAEKQEVIKKDIEWEYRFLFFDECENNPVDRWTVNRSYNVSKDMAYARNYAEATAVDGLCKEVDIENDTPQNRLTNLKRAIRYSFFRNNNYFPDSPEGWRAIGVNPDWITTADGAPGFEELMELCGGAEGIENLQPAMETYFFPNKIVEEIEKFVNLRTTKMDVVFDKFAQHIIDKIPKKQQQQQAQKNKQQQNQDNQSQDKQQQGSSGSDSQESGNGQSSGSDGNSSNGDNQEQSQENNQQNSQQKGDPSNKQDKPEQGNNQKDKNQSGKGENEEQNRENGQQQKQDGDKTENGEPKNNDKNTGSSEQQDQEDKDSENKGNGEKAKNSESDDKDQDSQQGSGKGNGEGKEENKDQENKQGSGKGKPEGEKENKGQDDGKDDGIDSSAADKIETPKETPRSASKEDIDKALNEDPKQVDSIEELLRKRSERTDNPEDESKTSPQYESASDKKYMDSEEKPEGGLSEIPPEDRIGDWSDYLNAKAAASLQITSLQKVLDQARHRQTIEATPRNAPEYTLLPKRPGDMKGYIMQRRIQMEIDLRQGLPITQQHASHFRKKIPTPEPVEMNIVLMIDGSDSMFYSIDSPVPAIKCAMHMACVAYEACKDDKRTKRNINFYSMVFGNNPPASIAAPGDKEEEIGQRIAGILERSDWGTALAPAINHATRQIVENKTNYDKAIGCTHFVIFGDGGIVDEKAALTRCKTLLQNVPFSTIDILVLEDDETELDMVGKKLKNEFGEQRVGTMKIKDPLVALDSFEFLLRQRLEMRPPSPPISKRKQCGVFTHALEEMENSQKTQRS